MNSIVVGSASTDVHLVFDPSTRVELLFRAALAGAIKAVAVGLRLTCKECASEVVWFEPRIPALDICADYRRKTRTRPGINSITWAREFVELLTSPEIDDDPKNTRASTLEKLSAAHFKAEEFVVNFDPYSLDDDAKVDIFFSYRRSILSVSVTMEMLVPFLKSDCLCSETKAERHCLLCGGR
jgi:hypothetical protein